MGLETGTYISDLTVTNPVSGDPKNQGDDHLRLIKATLRTTFPNISGAMTATHTELSYVAGVTSAIQTQINAKAPIASPTFTGTVTIPAGASISGFAPLASPTFTGTVTIPAGASISGFALLASPIFTGTPTAPTASTGTSTTQIATTEFVANTAFTTALPAQTGNEGKFITTDGTNASWSIAVPDYLIMAQGVK